jgi:hypothetical protein
MRRALKSNTPKFLPNSKMTAGKFPCGHFIFGPLINPRSLNLKMSDFCINYQELKVRTLDL